MKAFAFLWKCYTSDVSLPWKCWPQSIPQEELKKETKLILVSEMYAQTSSKLSKQQLSVVNTQGTGLLLNVHSDSFIAALHDIWERASSVCMKGSA